MVFCWVENEKLHVFGSSARRPWAVGPRGLIMLMDLTRRDRGRGQGLRAFERGLLREPGTVGGGEREQTLKPAPAPALASHCFNFCIPRLVLPGQWDLPNAT